MYSTVKSQPRVNLPFFLKSPLTLVKRRRRVRFDTTIVTHQLPPDDLPSAPRTFSNDYLDRKIKECYLLKAEKTAKMYLKECEMIKRKLRRQEATDSNEGSDATASSSSCSPTSHDDSYLEKHISQVLLEGLRLSNYRGLESGSFSRQSAHMPTIAKSVVEHYHQCKRRHNFLNKCKISEEVSMFAHTQTLPDQHWARVMALVDERIVER